MCACDKTFALVYLWHMHCILGLRDVALFHANQQVQLLDDLEEYSIKTLLLGLQSKPSHERLKLEIEGKRSQAWFEPRNSGLSLASEIFNSQSN